MRLYGPPDLPLLPAEFLLLKNEIRGTRHGRAEARDDT